MRIKLSLLLLLCCALPGLAQTGLKGKVVDATTGAPVANANVMLKNQAAYAMTSSDGSFTITGAAPGADVMEVVAYRFDDYSRDVEIKKGLMSDLGELRLSPAASAMAIGASDDFVREDEQLLDDESMAQSIGTIQGATDNIFYQAANYNFSVTRFRLRGLDSQWTTGYINGFEFNDAIRGRFNFSGLGGMTSSAFRQKTVDIGLDAANYGFGNVGGASNFTTYASEYAPGFRGNVSYTNSNYMLRAMLQYSTGLNKHGWAVSASIIGRYAPEGVIEGTFYNSLGYALSVQKVFNDKHSLNLTTWGAPTQRATNSAVTQEACDLAGTNLYNPNWGYLDGKKRSAKVVESFDPAALLNWQWKPRMGTTLNTGVGFRHSAYSSSALQWYQAADPRPDYYRYLPSYFRSSITDLEADGIFSGPQYDQAVANYELYDDLWRHDKHFRQLDWNMMYQTNYLNSQLYDRNPELTGISTYIIENRHSNFTSWMFNSYLDHRINDFMTLQGGVSFNYTDAHYYKTVRNLLGGEFWLDVDNFAERDFPDNPEILQNDLNNPNRRVKEGDKFGYDYNIRSYIAKAWLQNKINTVHWDVNYGLEVTYTNFIRKGNMRNGRAPENSYGNGQRHTFDDAAIKAGATYKLNGRNYFTLHAAYGTEAPLPDNAYISVRTKDTAVPGLSSTRYLSADLSYTWNYSRFRGGITGFFTHMWDVTKRWAGYYDDILSTYMNYSTSGLETEYKGVELGMSYKILPSLSVSAAATFAQYQYKNNPMGVRSYENGAEADIYRRVYLKNYHLGGTPQQAYMIAVNYAAPKNWFFELNANWFGDAYIDLAPARHEVLPELYSSLNVTPGASRDELLAQLEAKRDAITKQDKLRSAFVMNLSIGKVLYMKWGSMNFNLSVNNLLNNRNIQTGGFQQGRVDYNNYTTTRFPNKYYYAQGIRVFFNFGIRF